MQTVEEKLSFLSELIACNEEIWFWEYDRELNLLKSSCLMPEKIHEIFTAEGRRKTVLEHYKDHRSPMVLPSEAGYMWVVDAEMVEGMIVRLHVFGPVCSREFTPDQIRIRTEAMHLPETPDRDMLLLLYHLPVVTLPRLYEYGIMFHYCITGERISMGDFSYEGNLPDGDLYAGESREREQLRNTFVAEQRFLRKVENGDVTALSTGYSELSSIETLGTLSLGSPTRQLKNLLIASVTLVSRAAIRGGLAPEFAYTLSDEYIRQIEAGNSFSELVEISTRMQLDFTGRVRRIKERGDVSAPVQSCCDYILLHIREPITVHDVAVHAGYSDNYLGKKFQREMHTSVKQYIKECRIQAAQDMIRSGVKNLQEVAQQLSYGTQSYFSSQFREVTGMTPAEYRDWCHKSDRK